MIDRLHQSSQHAFPIHFILFKTLQQDDFVITSSYDTKHFSQIWLTCPHKSYTFQLTDKMDMGLEFIRLHQSSGLKPSKCLIYIYFLCTSLTTHSCADWYNDNSFARTDTLTLLLRGLIHLHYFTARGLVQC